MQQEYPANIGQARSVMDYVQNRSHAEIMQIVRDAVAGGDVQLAFQPIVQAGNGHGIAFYEGLLRVLDPAGCVIPAREFMPFVETIDLGRDLDVAALQLGLDTLSQQPHIRLAINMSARSIGYGPWMACFQQAMAQHPRIGERLILEITEASAMLVPELAVSFMREVQKFGVGFALDDFGAGNTSFRYLKDFQFDILKIDGQFIRNVARDPDNQVLTRALVSIAKQFEIFTVAEFVENREDAQWLAANGLDCLQGYYFGAPSLTPPWQAADDNTEAQRAFSA